MNLTRREVIKNLLITAGGVCVLPSCLYNEENASIRLKYIKINSSDEKLLTAIAETIIPTTDTPGAKGAYTHLFTLKMVDDCFEQDKHQEFVKGLGEINSISKKQSGNSFINSTFPQREQILKSIENKKGYSKEVLSFYDTMKNLTIQGYLVSKPVMTKLVVYELAPGRFHGSFPINN